MICDAHVHVGYFSRKGEDEPFYYSPRRILGVLDRCGVDEFVVSSTCAQIDSITIGDIVNEAKEMKRIAGRRAHLFFWLSGHLYDEDRSLSWVESGLFEGIKLHEMETPWMQRRRGDLEKVLRMAEDHDLPIQLHCPCEGCMPFDLEKVACSHPRVRFDFAHCCPEDDMADVIARCPNVWTDVACLPFAKFDELKRYHWHGHLMFGTDLPTWQAKETVGLTKRYRDYQSLWCRLALPDVEMIDGAIAFHSFLGK